MSGSHDNSEIHSTLDKEWRSATRILFSRDIGPLRDFQSYLKRLPSPLRAEKSALSAQAAYFSSHYAKGSKFALFEEKEKLQKLKLPTSSLRDLDSILQNLGEISYYAGSKVLGNSSNCALSDNVIDSSFVLDSHEILTSAYVAYSELTINCKHLFGCSSIGDSQFCVNSCEFSNAARIFESVDVYDSRDAYYCYYCRNCADCLFSFNQYSKKNLIGNVQFEKTKYGEMKADLLRQLTDELLSKRTAPSLSAFVSPSAFGGA